MDRATGLMVDASMLSTIFRILWSCLEGKDEAMTYLVSWQLGNDLVLVTTAVRGVYLNVRCLLVFMHLQD